MRVGKEDQEVDLTVQLIIRPPLKKVKTKQKGSHTVLLTTLPPLKKVTTKQ